MNNIVFRDDGCILVKNVRLSYEHLFEKWAGEEGQEKKYSGRFHLDKKTHKKEIVALREWIEAFVKEHGKGKKAASRKWFFRDGDHEEEKPDTAGLWYISASEKTRPNVINRDRSPVAADDDIVYSGCYGNVLIRPWFQNNQFGIRVNANLLAFQFMKDGERFSGISRPDVDEAFDDEEDGSDEDPDDGL